LLLNFLLFSSDGPVLESGARVYPSQPAVAEWQEKDR